MLVEIIIKGVVYMVGKIVMKGELRNDADIFGFEEYIFLGDLYLKSSASNGWSPVGEKKFFALKPCLEGHGILPDFNRTVEAEIEEAKNNNTYDFEINKIISAEKLPDEK